MLKLRMLWENLRSSFWFIPGLIVLIAVGLALGLVQIDDSLQRDGLYDRWPRLLDSGAEGARGLLETVANAMIAVAGVVFSITIVALSLASNQYTSRVLRKFMRDRVNQSVLGVFVGIYAYCLVVLRTIRGTDELLFVPSIAILFGLLLAFVGIAVFIYFIHHIALSIQAVTILAEITDETLVAIDLQFPDDLDGEDDEEACSTADPGAGWLPILGQHNGYVQSFDASALLTFAQEHDTVIRAIRSVGDFVVKDTPIAYARSADAGQREIEQLGTRYAIGRQRTVEQDPGFGIRQIVDVAMKALSPGINDTTTAVMCINHLTAILHQMTGRRISCQYRAEDSRVRLLTCGPSYADFVDVAFAQIRQNASANVAVLASLLGSLELLMNAASSKTRHLLLATHVELVAEVCRGSVAADRERQQLLEEASALLAKVPSTCT